MKSADYMGWIIALVVFCIATWGNFFDDNKEAVYGSGSNLPVNCRAYVQVAVNGFRSGEYPADQAMNGLERNCGIAGNSWKDRR